MYDVLVTGDGEIAIFEAYTLPPRIVEATTQSQLFLSNTSLEQMPFPARHLVDVASYQYSIDGTRALSMIAQLGCPFGCGFCGGTIVHSSAASAPVPPKTSSRRWCISTVLMACGASCCTTTS